MNIGLTRDEVKADEPGKEFSWLMVLTTTGTVVYSQAGYVNTTITNAPLNVWLPVGRATNIRTESTAAGFIVA